MSPTSTATEPTAEAPQSFMLPVSDGHALHIETFGAQDGVPVVHLHGGPGSGAQPDHRKLFDPARHRAVLYDQRGAGRSTPHRSRVANTTAHHIADLEAIRTTLGIDRWVIAGGSWGATLALAYAQAHPEHVAGLVLRATFLGTRVELERAFLQNLPAFRPALYADFLGLLSEAERTDPLASYWRRILDPDPAVHVSAAWAWHDTERALSQVSPKQTRLDAMGGRAGPLPSTPFMEAHYFSQDCFLAPNQLLENASRIASIPGIIVQGRYDLLCPPATATVLADTWGNAELRIIEHAGHAMSEPGITEAVREAIAALT